jgi:hypothetical protein
MRASIRFPAYAAVAMVALATCGTASAVASAQKVAGTSTATEVMRTIDTPRGAGVRGIPGALALTGQAGSASASQDEALTGVSCVTPANCMAVGLSNTNSDGALAETWNGRAWKTVPVPVPAQGPGKPGAGSLSGVSCTSAARCVAVGSYLNDNNDNGSLLVETWNGRAWTIAPVPQGSGGTLSGVSCATAKSCVAVGYVVKGSGSSLVPIAESWNGAKWTLTAPPAVSGAAFSSLNRTSCVSPTYCVAVGAYLTDIGHYSALIETWNGKAWTRMAAPAPRESALEGVSCVSTARCVAVGTLNYSQHPAAFGELWNGRNWTVTKVTWPRGTGDSLLLGGVSCASASNCIATGLTGFADRPVPTGNTGRAAAVSWNGRAWTVTSVPSAGKGKASAFFGTACLAPADCVAVGQEGPSGSFDGNSLSGFWNGKRWRLVAAA